MLTKTIFTAGALLSVAAAVPLQQQNKRDTVWTTKVIEDVVTVDVTTTIWLSPGETAPAGAPGHYGHHHHKVTSHITSTLTVEPASSAPAEQSSYVAPSPSQAAPTTSQAPPPAPTSQAPAYSSQAPSPSQTQGGSGTQPNGATYTGDITHYDVGMGSCGWTDTDSEAVVAIPWQMMNNGANPNDNPLCGKTITISYQGSTHTAKIVDTCGGCSGASIDLSPSLFVAVAPNGDGRVHGVEWWYN